MSLRKSWSASVETSRASASSSARPPLGRDVDDLDLQLLERGVELVELRRVELELVERERDLLGCETPDSWAPAIEHLDDPFRVPTGPRSYFSLHRSPLIPFCDGANRSYCRSLPAILASRIGRSAHLSGQLVLASLGLTSSDGRGAALLRLASGESARPRARRNWRRASSTCRARGAAGRDGSAPSPRAGSARERAEPGEGRRAGSSLSKRPTRGRPAPRGRPARAAASANARAPRPGDRAAGARPVEDLLARAAAPRAARAPLAALRGERPRAPGGGKPGT